jgi:murein DD-endopeptidase MepM/ murein hydrolase activator NlpD
MNRQSLVVELVSPSSGQVKRIQISYKYVAFLLVIAVVFTTAGVGALSSYMRMFWKVSNYNALRSDFDRLRGRYQHLQQESKQNTRQMASLETLASEISSSYGINPSAGADSRPMDDDFASETNVKESIEQYNFLKAANYSHIYHHYAQRWQMNIEPSLWPVVGTVRSSFGGRSDPFSGEGAFHTGIDLTAPMGTDVRVTADGTVESAGWSGRYGKLVIIDHGNGIETYYAHLSQFLVVPGQEVRRNETIALSGSTGHATGAHLHYEVRVAGTPVNPMKYLGKPEYTQMVAARAASGHNDLGL